MECAQVTGQCPEQYMAWPDNRACQWCEQRPAENGRPLCWKCRANKGVALLYRQTVHDRLIPGWAEHILALRRLAAARQPLFTEVKTDASDEDDAQDERSAG